MGEEKDLDSAKLASWEGCTGGACLPRAITSSSLGAGCGFDVKYLHVIGLGFSTPVYAYR
jgi:hypothetical protein